MKKPSGVRKEDLQQLDKEMAPMTFKEKMNMLDDKVEKLKGGEIPEFNHQEMKCLWGRLQTGLNHNQKAKSMYKDVCQLPAGNQKRDKQPAVLWAWLGP